MTDEQKQVIREMNEIRAAVAQRGAVLRRAAELGLSQYVIAKEIGMPQPTVSRWLSGNRSGRKSPARA